MKSMAILISGLLLVGCASSSRSLLQESARGRAYQLNARGRVAYNLGKYGEAVEYFAAAYETYPDDDRIAFNLGQAYRMQGKYARAVALFRVVLEIAPKDTPDHQEFIEPLPALILRLEQLIEEEERVANEPPHWSLSI